MYLWRGLAMLTSTRRRWPKSKIYAAADSSGLRPDRRGNGQLYKQLMQKQPEKTNPWNTIVTLRTWRSKLRARPNQCLQKQPHTSKKKLKRAIHGTRLWRWEAENPKSFLDKNSFKNHQKLIKNRRKLSPGVPPGRPKIEFAAKMAQDASKSDFQEALEAPWGRLGGPKMEPSWSKIEAGRVFFWSWKSTSITSCFWMHFWSFLEPLGEAKTSISYWRGCKNQLFRKLHFNIVLRPILEGFWGPSWGQVGAKLGQIGFKIAFESYLKVKLIFYRKYWILDPPRGSAAVWGPHLWGHEKTAFWDQKCNISIGFLRFCKIVPVRAQWRSHLKVTFFMIVISLMWLKYMCTCICGED